MSNRSRSHFGTTTQNGFYFCFAKEKKEQIGIYRELIPARHPERRAARLPTEVEVLRMQRSKTEERLRRRDLRKIFVDPNAYGVALPAVGFDSENAALWRFLRSG